MRVVPKDGDGGHRRAKNEGNDRKRKPLERHAVNTGRRPPGSRSVLFASAVGYHELPVLDQAGSGDR